MRKTVTTILSLALALILVSSLSSGVILAKGDDDHDNRKKNKNKYHTVRDVAILDCLAVTDGNGGKIVVVAFDISGDLPDLIVVNTNDSCAASLALLLKAGFRKHDESTGVETFILAKSRYTMVRSRKVKDVADE